MAECPICGSSDFCMASGELGYFPMIEGLIDADPRDPEEEDGDDDEQNCGRWDNGTLGRHCRLAGTEDCAFCLFAHAWPRDRPRARGRACRSGF